MLAAVICCLTPLVEQLEVVRRERADRLATLGDEGVEADDVGDGAEQWRRLLRRRLLLRVCRRGTKADEPRSEPHDAAASAEARQAPGAKAIHRTTSRRKVTRPASMRQAWPKP